VNTSAIIMLAVVGGVLWGGLILALYLTLRSPRNRDRHDE
jgi:hypothetical protein